MRFLNISKRYGENQVFDRFSLDFLAGCNQMKGQLKRKMGSKG